MKISDRKANEMLILTALKICIIVKYSLLAVM